jgi:NADH:ubiquinone oxidoreductase subunit F (NADH-binding)
VEGIPVARLFYTEPSSGEAVPLYKDINFFKKQERVVLHNCGHINPERIEDYITAGGYEALRRAVTEMTPDEVINEVKSAGLRGRGGGGFPAALKWEICRRSDGGPGYIVCNADEGDPGSFMDRCLLESDPHSVIEGLTIAAYAAGAHEGYIYVRSEYTLAVKRIRLAVEAAEEKGFSGKNILGTDFSFYIYIKEGVGAYVCGEETALIATIEGRRGVPRPRPPYPAESGLRGKPTVINNVKTLASVPAIISRGAGWYSATGTVGSSGTAVVSLTGKIVNSGLVEVPMGTTLKELVYDIGGGIPAVSVSRRYR